MGYEEVTVGFACLYEVDTWLDISDEFPAMDIIMDYLIATRSYNI